MSDAATMYEPLSAEELATKPTANASKPAKEPIVPVPEDAPPMRIQHPKHGQPSNVWPYHDAEGCLVGYICRWDFFNAKGELDKGFWPVCYCKLGDGRRAWCPAGMPCPRPLYRLPDILANPEATVLVCEGEKAADAAAELFPDLVVTTPPHGAKSPHKADWKPVKGHPVLAWGDNDDAGSRFAVTVARLSLDSGAASVGIVEVPADFPEKWDLANAAPKGWTAERLRGLLEAAHPYEPEPAAEPPQAPAGYVIRENGHFWRDPTDPDKPDMPLAGPFEVLAETRDAEGNAWGVLLRWHDHDGREHQWAMPRATLAGDGAEARRALMDGGLFVAPGRKARELLNSYLAQIRVKARARAVSRIGWHDHAFVLPDETLGDTGGEHVLLQTTATFEHAFRVRGTLADWQKNIARYATGNSRLLFSLSAAFAAPLLHHTEAESGGFHFRGPSSIGKTTALAVAGSAWGGGGVKGYLRQWRATDNGLEAVAQAHCDTLLCLDELSQIDAKAAGATAYMLANGAGKSRAKRTGEGRAPAEWRVLFLSSGETGLANKVAEDGRGRKLAAGQKVRVIDLPADSGCGFGMFEDIHGFESADAFARHLKQAASEYYGTAAPNFVAKIATFFIIWIAYVIT